jgi:hypothetical protein
MFVKEHYKLQNVELKRTCEDLKPLQVAGSVMEFVFWLPGKTLAVGKYKITEPKTNQLTRKAPLPSRIHSVSRSTNTWIFRHRYSCWTPHSRLTINAALKLRVPSPHQPPSPPLRIFNIRCQASSKCAHIFLRGIVTLDRKD